MMRFKQLTPENYPDYIHFFDHQRYPMCAYSLSSIIAWTNNEYTPFGAELDGALIVAAEFKEEKRNRHLILPVTPRRVFTPVELAAVAKRAGYSQYWFVPENYLQDVGEEAVKRYFTVKHQGAFDDYVYRVADLAGLKGNRYSKKRNLINQFRRDYVDAGKVAVEPIGRDDVEDCLIFLEEWCQERDCDADDQVELACEKQAAINALTHLDTLELKGILLRIDGRVSAFGISAPLTDDMATLQYEKAFAGVKGLYQYFDNACARMLFNGYTYLNKESDMGIPGLAKAKKSYHPFKMVRALRLILKNEAG